MIKNISKKILATILVIACLGTGVYGVSSKASIESAATPVIVETDSHIYEETSIPLEEDDSVLEEDIIDIEEDNTTKEKESLRIQQERVNNEDEEDDEVIPDVQEEYLNESMELFEDMTEDVFVAVDEDGNITTIPLDDVDTPDFEALANVKQISDDGVASISTNATYGVAVFHTTNATTSYIDVSTGVSGYTHGSYAPDAAYLGLSSGSAKFKLSGVTGLVSTSSVTIYEYDDFIKAGYITSTYTTKNGRLYHNITTNLKNIASTQHYGYQQSYMSNNTTYYSYDGHYFYTSYKTMVTDYKNGVYTNSINPKKPYYNYYMYLSHRSTTNFSATEMNTYLTTKTSSTTSKMLNTGSSFVSLQNTYGSNAALMFGLAMNESAYGTSTIAQSKNNLFGHGAVDSNPYYGANGYSSAYDSIKYHAEYYISRGYTAASYDWRYFGSHVGNKQSGINVKYASDPYWGEKAASHCFQLEDVNSSTITDFNRYVIGVVHGSTPVYNSPNSTVLYYLKNKSYSATYNVPVIILGSTTSGGVTWYKIQSDMPIASGRGSTLYSKTYSFTNDYAYVKASLVTIVNAEVDDDISYVIGDASGDGNVTSLDYILVKNHIMGTSTLSGSFLLAADTSEDGKVTSLDYIQIRNHIMGTSLLF